MRKLKSLSYNKIVMTEKDIIDFIAEKLKCNKPKKGFGHFGDDGMVLPLGGVSESLVLSTDAFVEKTHFTKDMGFLSAGWKSLVGALSDIYAMGARPSFYTLNLVVPIEFTEDDLHHFVDGLLEASMTHDVSLLGGDVTRGEQFIASLQVGGYLQKQNIKTSFGAHKGDMVITDKLLGKALLGFYQFKNNITESEYIEHFLFPKVSTNVGPWLGTQDSVTSLTDISDGLFKELSNLCDAKDLAVRIEAIPYKKSFAYECEKLELDPERIVLEGGEEYSLLWTVKPDELQSFLTQYQIQFKKLPYILGRVEGPKKKNVKIIYENQSLIESIRPFEHFSS